MNPALDPVKVDRQKQAAAVRDSDRKALAAAIAAEKKIVKSVGRALHIVPKAQPLKTILDAL